MAEKELTAEEQIKALQDQLAKERADKEKQAKALNDQLAQERAEREELEALNQEQAEALALAEAQKGKALPVIQDKKKNKYQVMAAKFQHPETGATVTAEELAKDKGLIDLLVGVKSGLLVAYVEPSK